MGFVVAALLLVAAIPAFAGSPRAAERQYRAARRLWIGPRTRRSVYHGDGEHPRRDTISANTG